MRFHSGVYYRNGSPCAGKRFYRAIGTSDGISGVTHNGTYGSYAYRSGGIAAEIISFALKYSTRNERKYMRQTQSARQRPYIPA